MCSSVLGTHVGLLTSDRRWICVFTHTDPHSCHSRGFLADIAATGHAHRVPSNATGTRVCPLAAREGKDVI